MSKGPGQVQRAIMAAFESEPDNAFLLSELCERAYPRINQIQGKHRVAVTGAAKTNNTNDPIQRQTLGRELVFYDPLNVMSYAMARLKSDFIDGEDYRNNDPRKAQLRKRSKRKATTEQDLRKRLAPGERQHKHIVQGRRMVAAHGDRARQETRRPQDAQATAGTTERNQQSPWDKVSRYARQMLQCKERASDGSATLRTAAWTPQRTTSESRVRLVHKPHLLFR